MIEPLDQVSEVTRIKNTVFKLIARSETKKLKTHLSTSKNKIDIRNIYNESGYSPIHYAAYKNFTAVCEVIVEFMLSEDAPVSNSRNKRRG